MEGRADGTDQISWLVSDGVILPLLSWLFACLLLVELDFLLDLEFCLSWTRVCFEIDDFEIIFEDRCMDLVCCLILSCPEITKERRREEEKRVAVHVTQTPARSHRIV